MRCGAPSGSTPNTNQSASGNHSPARAAIARATSVGSPALLTDRTIARQLHQSTGCGLDPIREVDHVLETQRALDVIQSQRQREMLAEAKRARQFEEAWLGRGAVRDGRQTVDEGRDQPLRAVFG
jgi:hypothetical protein